MIKLYAIILAIFVLFLDQITKLFVLDFLRDGSILINNNFNLVLVYNTGISFSLFQMNSYSGQLILASLGGLIVIFLFLWLLKLKNVFHSLALGLIIGGALGNIFDRIIRGGVIDFIDLHIFDYHWPAFNFADSAIVVGALGIIYKGFFKNKTKKI
ncbi:signal peptidase II [Alphaproteobacteria bacterium]|nr:signal peptidase II [Alphaproteobacteria bacterium]